MNLSTMRTLVRRRVQEKAGDQWTDEDIDEVINVALQQVQKVIIRTEPESFLKISHTALVSGTELYPHPTDMWAEIEVAIKDVSAPRGYTPLDKGDYAMVSKRTSEGSTPQYARFGKNFFIGPMPTENVAQGLRIIYTPMVTVAGDNTVPEIHLALHIAIVYWAQIILLGETSESTKDIREVLWGEDGRSGILGDVSLYYYRSAGKPAVLELPSKEY